MTPTTKPHSAGLDSPSVRLDVLQALRGIAATLVVYDHLVGMWLGWAKVRFLPAELLQRWVFGPLHLMQHGGALGVALFFLLSGFVISLAAQRERAAVFTLRRLLRIYPPLWASIAFIFALYGLLRLAQPETGLWQHLFVPAGLRSVPDVPHVLASMSLLNYLVAWPPINGVAWTLIIEMLFYLWVALLIVPWRRWPRMALTISGLALALLQWQAHASATVFLLAVNGVYVSYLLLGACWYFLWSGRIGWPSFATFSLLLWLLFLRGIDQIVAQPPFTFTDYAVSYAFAWVLFGFVLHLHQRWQPGLHWLMLGKISYSLYLYHGALGLITLDLLTPALGFPLALLATLTIVLIVSYVAWRLIELPSQKLAHRVKHFGHTAEAGTPSKRTAPNAEPMQIPVATSAVPCRSETQRGTTQGPMH